MLHHPDPTVQVQGAFGLSRLGPDARLDWSARTIRLALLLLVVFGLTVTLVIRWGKEGPLQGPHPRRVAELLFFERALNLESNAQAKLTSVKGLGRSFSWEGYLARWYELPLLDGCPP